MSRELIELTPELIEGVDYRSGDEYSPYFFHPLLKQNPEDYIAYAGIVDNEIVGLGAILRCFPKVGVAFSTFAEGIMESAYNPTTRWIFKTMKEVIIVAQKQLDLHRIQAYVKTNDSRYIRFIEHLGFHREGRLKQFWIDRSDFYLYARYF